MVVHPNAGRLLHAAHNVVHVENGRRRRTLRRARRIARLLARSGRCATGLGGRVLANAHHHLPAGCQSLIQSNCSSIRHLAASPAEPDTLRQRVRDGATGHSPEKQEFRSRPW